MRLFHDLLRRVADRPADFELVRAPLTVDVSSGIRLVVLAAPHSDEPHGGVQDSLSVCTVWRRSSSSSVVAFKNALNSRGNRAFYVCASNVHR
jgi:hypothetical protein